MKKDTFAQVCAEKVREEKILPKTTKFYEGKEELEKRRMLKGINALKVIPEQPPINKKGIN